MLKTDEVLKLDKSKDVKDVQSLNIEAKFTDFDVSKFFKLIALKLVHFSNIPHIEIHWEESKLDKSASKILRKP